MLETQSNLKGKHNYIILKDDFSSRTDPSIVTSMPPVLLDQSNETSWVSLALKSTSHFQCLIDQLQKPILVAATDHIPDHT